MLQISDFAKVGGAEPHWLACCETDMNQHYINNNLCRRLKHFKHHTVILGLNMINNRHDNHSKQHNNDDADQNEAKAECT